MGKPKEKPKKPWRKPEEVTIAKPLVEKVAKAKARLGKVKEKHAGAADPRHRAARKRVKRAQRRLREVLKYDAQRAKAKPAAEAAAPAAPAAAAPAAEAPAS
jgi:hypothetical protein